MVRLLQIWLLHPARYLVKVENLLFVRLKCHLVLGWLHEPLRGDLSRKVFGQQTLVGRAIHLDHVRSRRCEVLSRRNVRPRIALDKWIGLLADLVCFRCRQRCAL